MTDLDRWAFGDQPVRPNKPDLYGLLSSPKIVKRATQQLGTYVPYEAGLDMIDGLRRAAGTRRGDQLRKGIQYD